MKQRFLAFTLAMLISSAAMAEPAQPAPKPEPAPPQASQADPIKQALVQMIREAQDREASALIQSYALQAQVTDLNARITAEKKRADEAEAKLKTSDPVEPAKP